MSGRSGLADTTTSMPSGVAATEQPALGTRAPGGARLAAKRAGMVVFSSYPADPRPRRAAAALLDEGMHIDLICEADDKSPRREALGGLAITRIPIRHIRGGALSYTYQYASFILISAAIFAWRSLRRRYDLIYVHNMPDILVVAALVPKLLGARVILDQPTKENKMTMDLTMQATGTSAPAPGQRGQAGHPGQARRKPARDNRAREQHSLPDRRLTPDDAQQPSLLLLPVPARHPREPGQRADHRRRDGQRRRGGSVRRGQAR